MKYNLHDIMTKAWKLFHKFMRAVPFGECLRRAWLSAKSVDINARRILDAKTAAGVTEETYTWSGWQKRGYAVIHGSKALFGCDLIWGSRGGDKPYKARFFGASQVQPIDAA